MAEIALNLDPLRVELLATPLHTLNLEKYPALIECLARARFAHLYELARKTPNVLKGWGFTGEAIKQATALLRALNLKLGMTIAGESLLAIQEATYRHGAPRRSSTVPAPDPW